MRVGYKGNRGFSLIELAVLVTIFGLIGGTMSTEYSQYAKTKALNDTLVRQNEISEAFSRYERNFGTLPCPASPSLPPDDPNAGKANCAQVISQFPAHTSWHPGVSCTTPTINPITNFPDICIVQGARPTSNNPTYCPSTGGPCGAVLPGMAKYNDPVIIGTLPYVDLGIALNDSVDGWGNRLTYAVTYYLTDLTKFNSVNGIANQGVIGQENYNSLNDSIVPTPNTGMPNGASAINAYMLALVSHGPDGKGAWNYQGKRPVPCDMTPIDKGVAGASPTSTGRDNENCNGDAIFLANGIGSSDTVHALTSLVHGSHFYDDAFVMTTFSMDVDKWSSDSLGIMSNALGASGKVGIGTSSPQSALDVQGNIKANNYEAPSFCDLNTGNCFQQNLLSPGLDCNNGLMIGVANSQPLCQTLITTTGITPATCPHGQFIYGIDASGKPKCSTP